jgi:type VI secretion system protein ImpI
MGMNLILEVSGDPAQSMGDARRKVLGSAGGRIGRAPDCDWVLSNRYVSRHHATVSCVDGVFHIESLGENGVAVNDIQNMLPRLERHALNSGDTLYIDEYVISVVIAEAPGRSDVSQESRAPELPLSPVLAKATDLDSLWPEEGDELDPSKKFLSRTAAAPTVPAQEPGRPPDPAWNHSSSLADHFNPPPVPPVAAAIPAAAAVFSPAAVAFPPAATIPQGWRDPESTLSFPKLAANPTARQSQAAETPTQPVQPRAASATGGFDVSAFLRAAGLDPESVPPETAATLGHILRSVVQGLIDVLRARAEFRNQFRLPVTRVQMSENNPLKFTINAEDALGALLRTRSKGYLPPLEAFEDAFDDIRFHQLAMLAGMRAGFESLMNRFDPKKLQEQSDRRSSGRFAGFGAKRRYWDRYVDLFEEMAGNADSVFQRLYGEEFSNAYERQLEELKRRRVNSSR